MWEALSKFPQVELRASREGEVNGNGHKEVRGDDTHEASGHWSSALCDEITGRRWDPNMVWAGQS